MPEPWLANACPPPSAPHRATAAARQAALTKPAGSLGALEALAIELCGLQSSDRPRADRAAVVLFAGDHGVTAQGVSAFPSSVTVEMLRNFAGGGAAISVLAAELGASLTVVDAGALQHDAIDGVITDKPRCGTRDFSVERALTLAEVEFAMSAGRRAIKRMTGSGACADIVILGEMGIGNTTSATAVASALIGTTPTAVVGAGTGLDPAGIARKCAVIDRALALHGLGPRRSGTPAPPDVLERVGGLEIAALTGAIIAAAQARLPVLVDGFIVTVAALAAVRINPSCRPWLLFSHASAEQGHAKVLAALDARPILDLALRLGEGSGAAIALPIVRLACALHNRMATFEEARVSGGPA